MRCSVYECIYKTTCSTQSMHNKTETANEPKPLMYETKVQLFALLPSKCLTYSTKPQPPLIHASSLGTVPVSIKLCMPLLLYVQLLF